MLATNIFSYTHYQNDSLNVPHSRLTENFRTNLHQPKSCNFLNFCYICPTHMKHYFVEDKVYPVKAASF